MKDYTKKAVEDKFDRMLKRPKKDKKLLEDAKVGVTEEVLKAFFVGRADTLIYDLVGSLEAKAASEEDRKLFISYLLPKIDSHAKKHA